MKKILFVSILFCFLLTACLTMKFDDNDYLQEQAVNIIDRQFNPDVLQIKKDTKVVWVNQDDMDYKIQIEGIVNFAKIPKEGKFSYIFRKPGTYEVVNMIFPDEKSKIVVK